MRWGELPCLSICSMRHKRTRQGSCRLCLAIKIFTSLLCLVSVFFVSMPQSESSKNSAANPPMADLPKEVVSHKYASFWADLKDALAHRELWFNLAWQDIKLRYIRSKIGPFWITISTMLFIFSLGFMRSAFSGQPMSGFLPSIAFGLIPWLMISGIIGEAAVIYPNNTGYMLDIKINPLVLVFKTIMRALLIFGHDMVIFLFIVLFLKMSINWYLLLLLPGLLLVVGNIFLITVFLSLIGVRYRDFGQIVESVMRVLFFVTPIYWNPAEVVRGKIVVLLNPFSYYLNLIRPPLLGQPPALSSWIFGFASLMALSLIAAFAYHYKANRIAFWL